jgi:hypothetical protein
MADSEYDAEAAAGTLPLHSRIPLRAQWTLAGCGDGEEAQHGEQAC